MGSKGVRYAALIDNQSKTNVTNVHVEDMCVVCSPRMRYFVEVCSC